MTPDDKPNEQQEPHDDPAPQPPDKAGARSVAEMSRIFEADVESALDVYPLRDPSDDPGWAVKTVWVWLGFALLSLVFILVLLILGFIYD